MSASDHYEAAMRHEKMIELWGHKCDEFEPRCFGCQAWKLYESTRKVPSGEEVEGELEKFEAANG